MNACLPGVRATIRTQTMHGAGRGFRSRLGASWSYAHALLPIAGKGSSDWSYAWIPVVGPLIGCAAGVLVAKACGVI